MNLISFSLYGTGAMYIVGMARNIALAPIIYPGWTIRVYAPKSSHEALKATVQRGLKYQWVECPEPTGHEGMFWRFYPLEEKGIDLVIFRDADSRLDYREQAAVAEWILDGKVFHVMRDHEHHRHWPMLGGMWGCRGMAVPGILDKMKPWTALTKKMADMKFLQQDVWPIAQMSMTHHSSVACTWPSKPFPTHQQATVDYVGQVIDENEVKDQR